MGLNKEQVRKIRVLDKGHVRPAYILIHPTYEAQLPDHARLSMLSVHVHTLSIQGSSFSNLIFKKNLKGKLHEFGCYIVVYNPILG